MRSAQVLLFVALLAFLFSSPALAGTPMSNCVAVEAGAKAQASKDLAVPHSHGEALSDRRCIAPLAGHARGACS